MTLLVLGATDANARQIEELASPRGLRVATRWTRGRPAWVLAASSQERREALARYRLPAFRVIEHAGLARAGGVGLDVLTAGIARMAEIGADEPALSPSGVALTRRLMPWIATALERWLGGDGPDKAARTAEKASRREAVRQRPGVDGRARCRSAPSAGRRARRPDGPRRRACSNRRAGLASHEWSDGGFRIDGAAGRAGGDAGAGRRGHPPHCEFAWLSLRPQAAAVRWRAARSAEPRHVRRRVSRGSRCVGSRTPRTTGGRRCRPSCGSGSTRRRRLHGHRRCRRWTRRFRPRARRSGYSSGRRPTSLWCAVCGAARTTTTSAPPASSACHRSTWRSTPTMSRAAT